MFRIATALLLTILIHATFVINATFADEIDYEIGLNAFNDGLYDIAISSLNDFLKDSKDKGKNNYAKYILYKSYLLEKEYETSLKIIKEIEHIEDKRFDKDLIEKDKIFLFTAVDCESAQKESLKKADLIKIVLNSNCSLTDAYIKQAIGFELDNDDFLNLFYKSADNLTLTEEIFNKINIKTIKDEHRDYIAKFFYSNEKYDNFWEVYKIYKNDDLVNLALMRLFDIKNYEGFIDSFNYNKNYNISKSNYCRLIKSYEILDKNYNCDLIDKCIDDKTELLNAKTSCLIKNKDIDKLSTFIKTKKSDEIKIVCDNLLFGISNDIYDHDILTKFKSCNSYIDGAKILFKKGKYSDVIYLLMPGKNDEEYLLISASFEMLGDMDKSKEYLDKVKNKDNLMR